LVKNPVTNVSGFACFTFESNERNRMTRQLQESGSQDTTNLTRAQGIGIAALAAVLVLVVAAGIWYTGFMSGFSGGYSSGLKAAATGSHVDVTATVLKVDDGVKFAGNSTIKPGDPLAISLTPSDVVVLATRGGVICKDDLAIVASLTQQTQDVSCGWPAIYVALVSPL
jgi:hypothetical protein